MNWFIWFIIGSIWKAAASGELQFNGNSQNGVLPQEKQDQDSAGLTNGRKASRLRWVDPG